MEKQIPIQKMSKKKQRAYYQSRRSTWNGLNPVTRKTDNAKAYHRQKAHTWFQDLTDVPFVFVLSSVRFCFYRSRSHGNF